MSASQPTAEPNLTPARKRRFLSELARHGNVRVAAARTGLARSSLYLARQRDLAFAQAWRGALVLGRDQAAAEVAERAVEGWSEPVFYRGQQVGTRRRFDVRLLLAHLARLDRICAADSQAEALAGAFDELCGALGSGAELALAAPVLGPAVNPAFFAPGPCPMCPAPVATERAMRRTGDKGQERWIDPCRSAG